MTHRGPFQPLLFCDSVTRVGPSILEDRGWERGGQLPVLGAMLCVSCAPRSRSEAGDDVRSP